jgi:basic membrane lipoprotein Med (substrate-binding protein (PBP1-ABC) superfamily)
MNVFRWIMMVLVAGSTLAVASCGKQKAESASPAATHSADDGHGHGEDHSGHNH